MYLRGTARIAQASFTAGTTYNLLCCAAPAHQQVAVTGFGLYGTSNAAATPGLLEFATASSQGTSGTTVTPTSLVQAITTTFQSSWITQPSGAPGSIVPFESREVNPQGGISELWSQNDWYVIKDGGFFIVQWTPQFTGNYCAWMRIAE